jgi:hypothetical protein
MTEPTTWWRSACRDCGGLLTPVPADAHPSTGGLLWRRCRACTDTLVNSEVDDATLWDLLALIGDPAAATDLTAN